MTITFEKIYNKNIIQNIIEFAAAKFHVLG